LRMSGRVALLPFNVGLLFLQVSSHKPNVSLWGGFSSGFLSCFFR